MENLCETCVKNTIKFPYVQCRVEPFGNIITKTACAAYAKTGSVYAHIRFTYEDRFRQDFDALNRDRVHGLKHKGKRPIKVTVSTGGEFTPRQKKHLQNFFFKFASKAMHPIKHERIYLGSAKEILFD